MKKKTGCWTMILAFVAGALYSRFIMHRQPSPDQPPFQNYYAAERIPLDETTSDCQVVRANTVIGACRLTEPGTAYDSLQLVPLRAWANAQHQRVEWDHEERCVFIDGVRVPSPVFLVHRTAYVTPKTLQNFSGIPMKWVPEKRVVMVNAE